MTATFLMTFVLAAGSGEVDNAALLANARASFQGGAAMRHDAVQARAKFSQSAALYTQLWERGEHSPALALSMARAYTLAGDVPAALAAVHAGLRIAPYDKPLTAMLEELRGRVASSMSAGAESAIRPPRLQGLRHRLSDWDLFALVSLGVLLVVVGLARRWTVGDRWSMPVAATGGVLLGLVALAGWQMERERRQEDQRPLLIVKEPVYLRRGNGESYPRQLERPLPAGAEVRELACRGDWLQLELAGGQTGWLPESVVIRTATASTTAAEGRRGR